MLIKLRLCGFEQEKVWHPIHNVQNLTTLSIKGKVLLTYLNAKYYLVVNPDSSNVANFMPILLNLSQ
jgi:hypothetical protein